VKLGPSVGTLLAGCALIFVIDFPWQDIQTHAHWNRIGPVPFVSKPITARDIVLNVLLGVPIGVGAAGTFGGASLAAALVALPVSLVSEATQIYSHSRFPSATDVACNVIGAVSAATVFARRNHRR
jgi:glycopeptide antibiotics resistance protein